MHVGMLKTRAGFTLAEVLVALTLTAVLGATITGAFISQSRFFDTQEKVGAARAVSRGGLNMMLSELRMVEQNNGVVAAQADSMTVNVPYAMGLYCGVSSGKMSVSLLPVASVMFDSAGYSGFAYRRADASYEYEPGMTAPTKSGSCGSITVLDDGEVIEIPVGTLSPTPGLGTPVFLYQRVSYVFRESAQVSGLALWRIVHDTRPEAAELAAPFAATAGFGYYLNDSPGAQPTVASGSEDDITGIQLTLDGMSERPNTDGTHQSAPSSTSVFFRNR